MGFIVKNFYFYGLFIITIMYSIFEVIHMYGRSRLQVSRQIAVEVGGMFSGQTAVLRGMGVVSLKRPWCRREGRVSGQTMVWGEVGSLDKASC